MDRTDPGEAALIAGATLINTSLAGAVLLLAGADSAGTELALRTTARVSFVWFMLAFVASPLQQLRPSRLSDWLLRRRRALGVIFGLSMSIHVGFILRLYALHAPARPPMVTDADFFVGIPGLVLVALLTITSVEALKQRLGPIAWQRLHTTGIWVVWGSSSCAWSTAWGGRTRRTRCLRTTRSSRCCCWAWGCAQQPPAVAALLRLRPCREPCPSFLLSCGAQ